MTTTWAALKIGGGGFVTHLDLMADGTKVVGVDTYGAYLLVGGIWQQMVTIQSMPGAFSGFGNDFGTYDIRIAPSSTGRFYMLRGDGNAFRTDNSGGLWTHLALTPDAAVNTSDGYRGGGRYVAVDPANADVVFVGTPTAGLSKSADAGATWAVDSGVAAPTSTTHGGVLIAFDPSSTVTGGKTQGIYAASYGKGVYHSTDGGASWTLTTGTPTTCNHLIVDAAGIVWLIDDAGGNTQGNLRKFSAGSWSTALSAAALHAVAVDPANGAHVYVGRSGSELYVSTDTGASFVGQTAITVTASDIPWLVQGANDGQFSMADIVFDPAGSNLLYNANGIGVFRTNPPVTNTTVTWDSQTAGIENLDCNWVVGGAANAGGIGGGVSHGGPILVNCWDRPAFLITPGTYPSKYGAVVGGTAIKSAWGGDISPAGDAVVTLGNIFPVSEDNSGYTLDGGLTWHLFGSSAPFTTNTTWGGCIAASTKTNFVWLPDDNGLNNNGPWYTTDGGVTWSPSSVSGVALGGPTGWGGNYYNDEQVLWADRVTAGTFYAYNGFGDARQGVYKSTDGGATFSQVFAGNFGGGFGGVIQFRAVPRRAGHAFATVGNQGGPHPSATQLFRTSNGGATWTALSNVKETFGVGFGAAKPGGGGYPAIYVVGWVSVDGGSTYNYGIYRSVDGEQATPTWTLIGDGFPTGSYNTIKAIDGSNAVFGMVFVITGGNGAYVGTDDVTTVSLPPRFRNAMRGHTYAPDGWSLIH